MSKSNLLSKIEIFCKNKTKEEKQALQNFILKDILPDAFQSIFPEYEPSTSEYEYARDAAMDTIQNNIKELYDIEIEETLIL
jgi:hypothetical protein